MKGDSLSQYAAWPQRGLHAPVQNCDLQTCCRAAFLPPPGGQPTHSSSALLLLTFLNFFFFLLGGEGHSGLDVFRCFLTAFPFQTLTRTTGKRAALRTQAAQGRGLRL